MAKKILPANKKQHPLNPKYRERLWKRSKKAFDKAKDRKEIKVSNQQADPREQKKMKEPLSPSKRRALRIQKEDIASGETAAAKAFMTRNLPYTGDIHGKKLNKGGRAGFQHGGRTNLLEELGRVEGEHSNKNRRAEVSRIHGELNKGYKSGGAVLKGKKVGIQIK